MDKIKKQKPKPCLSQSANLSVINIEPIDESLSSQLKEGENDMFSNSVYISEDISGPSHQISQLSIPSHRATHQANSNCEKSSINESKIGRELDVVSLNCSDASTPKSSKVLLIRKKRLLRQKSRRSSLQNHFQKSSFYNLEKNQ